MQNVTSRVMITIPRHPGTACSVANLNKYILEPEHNMGSRMRLYEDDTCDEQNIDVSGTQTVLKFTLCTQYTQHNSITQSDRGSSFNTIQYDIRFVRFELEAELFQNRHDSGRFKIS